MGTAIDMGHGTESKPRQAAPSIRRGRTPRWTTEDARPPHPEDPADIVDAPMVAAQDLLRNHHGSEIPDALADLEIHHRTLPAPADRRRSASRRPPTRRRGAFHGRWLPWRDATVQQALSRPDDFRNCRERGGEARRPRRIPGGAASRAGAVSSATPTTQRASAPNPGQRGRADGNERSGGHRPPP